MTPNLPSLFWGGGHRHSYCIICHTAEIVSARKHIKMQFSDENQSKMNYKEYIPEVSFDYHMNINFVSLMEINKIYRPWQHVQKISFPHCVIFLETCNCISVSGGPNFTYVKRTGLGYRSMI